MRRGPLTLLLGLILMAACGSDPVERLRQDPDTLAVVGHYRVTRADFEALVRQNQAVRTQDPLVWSRLLDQLVRDLLVLNDSSGAPEDGLQTLGKYSDPAARAIRVDDTLQQRIYSRISVTDQDVKAYYQEHLDLYRKGPGILLREMQIPDEKRAREAYRQIMRGRPFIEVARQYGLPSDQGARYFQYDELPEYLQPVLSKKGPGAVTEPIAASSEFYQILIVVKRCDQYVIPLAEAREEIRLQLTDQKGELLLEKYDADLRDRFRVAVFWTKLPFAYSKEKP